MAIRDVLLKRLKDEVFPLLSFPVIEAPCLSQKDDIRFRMGAVQF